MKTSAFIIVNRNGIACASDADYSIHPLVEGEPVALVVRKSSPLPWKDIISSYPGKEGPEPPVSLADYADRFAAHIASCHTKAEGHRLEGDDLRAIIMGYGKNDIYPSICDNSVTVNEDGSMCLQKGTVECITHENKALWKHLGDFDCLSVIFNGTTPQMREHMRTALDIKYRDYKALVSNNSCGTEYETFIDDCFEAYDAGKIAEEACDQSTRIFNRMAVTGLETFSIEEMVNTCELLVNANNRLNHLKHGGKGQTGSTKEIAIVVRTEGLTWIKHSSLKGGSIN